MPNNTLPRKGPDELAQEKLVSDLSIREGTVNGEADCQILRLRKDIGLRLHNQIVGYLDQDWIWHIESHLHYQSAQEGGANPLRIRYFCEIKGMDGAARED